MKRAILTAAAFAACISTGSVYAQSGYLDLSHQNTDLGSKELDINALSGTMLLNKNLQLGGRYASFEAGSQSMNYFSIDGILFKRSESGAYGGYAGMENLINDNSTSNNGWFVGAFRQYITGNTFWTGQIGYSSIEGDIDVISVDAEARHFINENFSIQGNLGFSDIDSTVGSEKIWSGGAGAEFQFAGSPISIYADWQRIAFENYDSNQIGIGARWNFGSGSLMQRNRSGASFFRAMPTTTELAFGGRFAPR